MNNFKIVSAFNIGKIKKDPSSSQDAAMSNPTEGLFAISDGVSQSYFPKEWANLLVQYYCRAVNSTHDLFYTQNWQVWLAPAQVEWKKWVDKIVSQENIALEIKNAHAKGEPAAATFIGLYLKDDYSWQAMVVGDSVLLHLHDNRLIESYLLTDESDFNKTTVALSSYPDEGHTPSFKSGIWKTGDEFILATDGMAKWLLRQEKKGEVSFDSAIDKIRESKSTDDFLEFVRKQQKDQGNPLEDDDIAILFISSDENKQDLIEERYDPDTRPIVEEPVPLQLGAQTELDTPQTYRTLDEILLDSKPTDNNDIPLEETVSYNRNKTLMQHLKRRLRFERIFYSVIIIAMAVQIGYLYLEKEKYPQPNPNVTHTPETFTKTPVVTSATIVSPTSEPVVMFLFPEIDDRQLFLLSENIALSGSSSLATETKQLVWLEVRLRGWLDINANKSAIKIDDETIIIQNSTNLFVGPSINSQTLGTLMAGATGEIIQVDDASKSWVEIEFIGNIPAQFFETGN